MPALTTQDLRGSVPKQVTYVAGDGTDTFTLSGGVTEYLLMRNNTGVQKVVTMVGADAPANHVCTGFGKITTSPVSVTLEDGEDWSVPASNLGGVLDGLVTLTDATGVELALVIK